MNPQDARARSIVNTAIHEAGHAVVALALGRRVRLVSARAIGDLAGFALVDPILDRHALATVKLAGWVAPHLAGLEPRASSDIDVQDLGLTEVELRRAVRAASRLVLEHQVAVAKVAEAVLERGYLTEDALAEVVAGEMSVKRLTTADDMRKGIALTRGWPGARGVEATARIGVEVIARGEEDLDDEDLDDEEPVRPGICGYCATTDKERARDIRDIREQESTPEEIARTEAALRRHWAASAAGQPCPTPGVLV